MQAIKNNILRPSVVHCSIFHNHISVITLMHFVPLGQNNVCRQLVVIQSTSDTTLPWSVCCYVCFSVADKSHIKLLMTSKSPGIDNRSCWSMAGL